MVIKIFSNFSFSKDTCEKLQLLFLHKADTKLSKKNFISSQGLYVGLLRSHSWQPLCLIQCSTRVQKKRYSTQRKARIRMSIHNLRSWFHQFHQWRSDHGLLYYWCVGFILCTDSGSCLRTQMLSLFAMRTWDVPTTQSTIFICSNCSENRN